MSIKLPVRLAVRDHLGNVHAVVEITPCRELNGSPSDALIVVESNVAREHGESEYQLKETEVYEYELKDCASNSLRLKSGLSSRRRSLKDGELDAGLIETKNYCGTLLLELVDHQSGDGSAPVASCCIDVRSLKLDYRTEYRGMLRDITDRLYGLIADCESSAKVPLKSNFEDRHDAGWFQIQLELLRETLDGSTFDAAVNQILNVPDECLIAQEEVVSSDSRFRHTADTIRQLLHGSPRRAVPSRHPLAVDFGVHSIARELVVRRNIRDVDTPANRFVKHALRDILAFLEGAEDVLAKDRALTSTSALANRLAAKVENWLSHSFFQEIGEMRIAPLGNPVLQRKSGYREILRFWLRFRSAAELSWEGGEDVFRAGQRDVATLYEYWLFFVMLDWFQSRFGQRSSNATIHEIIDGLDEGSPRLKLKSKFHLGPFEGDDDVGSRRIKARFDYNRTFHSSKERSKAGSWTRSLRPDYTLTFWPAGLTQEEAERCELLVHIHFDAKYRVESIEGLFGSEGEEADERLEGSVDNYKRPDLLKMHAYRDAIRRSQGAYILYPGRHYPGNGEGVFSGYHEILPGLGAFGIKPDEEGKPLGMAEFEAFLEEVLSHLSNRASSQERVSYHIQESYTGEESGEVKEARAEYALQFGETDSLYPEHRAIPQAEQIVLAAWYRNEAQLELAKREDGFVFVRLGSRRGGLHVHPNFARTRHVILRTNKGVVAPGLFELREDGYRVFTRLQLRAELEKLGIRNVALWQEEPDENDEENIYALFRVRPSFEFGQCEWDGAGLMAEIEEFESIKRNRLVGNLGRSSPEPRLLSLQRLMRCLKRTSELI